MPANTVYVGRPTIFGNPFVFVGYEDWERPKLCYEAYREWLIAARDGCPCRTVNCQSGYPIAKLILAALPNLRGKNLACWCPLDQPCHSDVLLEFANS